MSEKKAKEIIADAQGNIQVALKLVEILASEKEPVEILDLAIRLLGLRAHVARL